MKKIIYYLFSGLLIILISCQQKTTKQENKPVITASQDSETAKTVIHQERKPIKQKDFDNLQKLPGSVTHFIPNGYSALYATEGDLNKDSIADVILILKKNGEENTSNVDKHPEKRPLLILTGQADKTYKLAAKNDNAVYCIDCGGMMGDPFVQITIKNGFFSVEHYGGSAWRWTKIVTFKYSAKDDQWFLHKNGTESFNANEPKKVETKILTVKDFGVVQFEKYDICKEAEEEK
jgi:hypothetical protein